MASPPMTLPTMAPTFGPELELGDEGWDVGLEEEVVEARALAGVASAASVPLPALLEPSQAKSLKMLPGCRRKCLSNALLFMFAGCCIVDALWIPGIPSPNTTDTIV